MVNVAVDYVQTGSSTLEATLRADAQAALQIAGNAVLDAGSTLRVGFAGKPSAGQVIPVLAAASLQGEFGAIELPDDVKASAAYTANGMSLTIQ